jgi:hypothetical protein
MNVKKIPCAAALGHPRFSKYYAGRPRLAGWPLDRACIIRPPQCAGSSAADGQLHPQLSNKSNDIMNTTHQSTAHSTPSYPSIRHYNRRYGVSSTDRDLVQGYTQLVTDRIKDGWSCYLLTFLFQHLPGSRPAVIDRMKDEVQRVYSTFMTRVHRKPRSASLNELPLLIGSADLQVYKRDKTSSPMVLCNDGLHFHAVLLVPATSRLKGSVEDHFRDQRGLYLRASDGMSDLHVRPVTHGYERVVDYVFKTVLRGRIAYDDGMLLLPRATRELGSNSAVGFDSTLRSPLGRVPTPASDGYGGRRATEHQLDDYDEASPLFTR